MDEAVDISATLTSDGLPVALKTAQATLRRPDGSVETFAMSYNSNFATIEFVPKTSGIYGVEVDITAQNLDGTLIDRAAFLSFEAQPLSGQITTTRLLVGMGLVLLLVVIILLWRWRKRSAGHS